MFSPLVRLCSLWISQGCRVVADNALRVWLFFETARLGDAERQSGWHLITALLMIPAIAFAPLNGALCNALAKPRVLVGSALFLVTCQLLFLILASSGEPSWLVCWALTAVGAAIYSPTRYALLPAGSQDTHIALPRVNGWFEMGIFAGVVGGMMLGGHYREHLTGNLPTAVLLSTLLNGLALFFALPVKFVSDVRRPESPIEAVRGFFRDVGRVVREPEPRACLVGLAVLRGLLTAMAGAFLPTLIESKAEDAIARVIYLAVWILAGVGAGSLLAGWQKHPRRILGLVPLGAFGMTVGLLFAAGSELPSPVVCLIFGVMAGLVNVPLAATYQADVPADARGNAMAIRNFAENVCIAILSLLLFGLARSAGWGSGTQLLLVAGLAGIMTLLAFWTLRRELIELVLEWIFLFFYRIRFAGPGLDAFPLKGPVLVIANHSCYVDPLLLGKGIPRSLIPMMTSYFFDRPLIRWFMVHIVRAIRVDQTKFSRERPELDAAVQALDRGECVVLFPEGLLRRKEEPPLKLFGQGGWRILQDRPTTPVVFCWIEGGWGSYLSYKDGPPGKNKKMDWFYPIGIGMGAAEPLPADVLADQRTTRLYMMKQVLQMRGHLGLEPFTLPNLKEQEDEA